MLIVPPHPGRRYDTPAAARRARVAGPGSSEPKQGPGCQVKQDPWSASSADSDHPVARWSFTPSPVRVDHHEVTSPYSGEGLGEDRKGKSREQGHVAEPGAFEC